MTIPARRTVRITLAAFAWTLATSSATSQDDAATSFAARVEAAHGRTAWFAATALEGRLALHFGGQPALAGRFLFRTNLGASRLELEDGTTAVFDGKSAWVSPARSILESARFHLLTWPYFAALPMKLRDPGTHLAALGERTLRGRRRIAARLTFDPGVGDTPDDWYVLYCDPTSGRLAAAAYIVTYGKTASAAAKEPHAITYEDYVALDGVQIATSWRFWHWSEEKGVHGEPIGAGALTDLRFVQPGPDAFVRPPGAREDQLPKP